MLQGIIEFLTSNWQLIAIMGLAGLLAYWVLDEYRDAEDAEETVEGVSNRAVSATGTALGVSRRTVTGFALIGMTAAVEFLQLASDLNQLFGGIPVIVGHLVFGGLVFIGAPTLGLSKTLLGFMFILITAVALMARYGGDLPGDS